MPNPTQKQINNRLDKLPPLLQEALADYKYLSVLIDIDNNHHLSPVQSESLAHIFGKIITGFMALSDLTATIKTTLKTDNTTTQKIVDALNRGIFIPLKDELAKLKILFPDSVIPQQNILNLKPIPIVPAGQPVPPPPPTRRPVAPQVQPKMITPSAPFPAPVTPPSPLTSRQSVSQTTPPPVPKSMPFKPIQKDFIRPTAPPTTPFVIQQKSKIEPINTPNIARSITPTTAPLADGHTPQSSPNLKPATARVEIGKNYRHHRRQKAVASARFKPTEQKVVDYSSLLKTAPRDPFANVPTTPPPPPTGGSSGPTGNSIPINTSPTTSAVKPGPELVGNTVDFKK